MYLKRLEMQGFKSFAKKADLTFNNKITIVVGPNGSGKSNIVDAVRWVLGEGSAKSLRGNRMEDLIFAGSAGKKPLGMAQVSLTLDNSTGIFPLDYSEIKVTRKLFRSGESEYLINNLRCRQRDIHELFMDTGIGRDSFSIIGQGKVDQILLSQAEEKRGLVEEAAGISRYRYRKNQAQRKLKDTESSLLRVWDILKELESQKEPLKEQAEKAEIYKERKGQLDDLEVRLSNYLIANLEEKIEELDKEVESKKAESLAQETKLRVISTAIEELHLSSEENNREITSLQEEIYALRNSINDHENKLGFAERMNESLEENLGKNQEESEKNQEDLESALKREDEEKSQYDEIFLEYKSAREELSQEEEDFARLKNSEGGIQAQIGDLRADLFDAAYRITEKRNQIIDLEKREAVIQSHEKNIDEKLSSKQGILQEKEKEEGEVQLLYKKEEEEAQLLISQLEEKEEERRGLLAKIAQKQEEIDRLGLARNGQLVKKQALEALEDNKEGYSAGVRSVFANQNLKGILGTVTDLARTSKEYRLALETALGASMQNIVTEDEGAAKEAIDYLRERKAGRATFLPLNIINQRNANRRLIASPQGLKRALDIISYDEKYENIFKHLLGHIYIAPDMERALAVNKGLSQPVRIVTLKGEVLDPRGAMTGGLYRKSQEGFFLRKERIGELAQEIIQADKKIEEEELLKKAYLEEEEKTRGLLQGLEERKESSRAELADLEQKKNQLSFQLSEFRKEKEILEMDRKSLSQEKEEVLLAKKEASQHLNEAEEDQKKKEEKLLLLQEKSQEEKDYLLEIERILNRKELAFNDIKNKKEIKEIQLADIRARKEELERRKSYLQAEKERIIEDIKENKNNKEESQTWIKEGEIRLGGLEKILEEKREARGEREEERKEKEGQAKLKQKLLSEIKDSLHSREITLEKHRTEINNLKENLLERFDIVYERSISIMAEELDEKESRAKVRQLRRQIDSLGEVNLMAIGEYEKLLERYDFLNKQSTDLDQAKDSLLELIGEMDQIIEKEFKDTFNQLNQAFSETFKEMFNGGSAELIMTDKDNVLETGIEIIAQPPGKTPRHLSLLSGGEKAMTAICLLFAIIKIKPGPFVILDEIEASLDESNVRRFASFLKKFAELTQFIVISHRKGTMEAGDILYGVTMEEKGVSSLISVRISDTIKLTS